MILLCGIPTEGPLALVATELDALGMSPVWFNQRHFDDMAMELAVGPAGVGGTLRVDDRSYRLADVTAVYTRVMDDRLLPELEGEDEGSDRRRACRELHETLSRWLAVTPARVVNPAAAGASNASKPFQAQIVAGHGFAVPDTLVTNDPAAVRAFRTEHGRVVYKSVSGVRSMVELLDEGSLRRLPDVRWCPVQFQAYVDGTNIRVHTVGDEVFATLIRTDATDYRYASRSGAGPPTFEVTELAPEEAARCVALARGLGLPVAGIDLKRAPDGRLFCFEVNPSPAYSYYERQTGQPIARAIARYLAS